MNVEERIEREERQDVQNILSTENGRRFLWRMLSHCGIYRDVAVLDSNETAKALGRRAVGLYMLGVVSDVDEDLVFLMMKEARERDKRIAYEAEQEGKKMEEENQTGDFVSESALGDDIEGLL